MLAGRDDPAADAHTLLAAPSPYRTSGLRLNPRRHPIGKRPIPDLNKLDLDEMATALADQTTYEHRWLTTSARRFPGRPPRA